MDNLLMNELFDVSNPNYDKMINILNNPNPLNEEYTEMHHIIPRFFYKLKNMNIDNSDNNLVQMSIKNHFLVHYYGAKCANDKYRSRLWFSVIRTLGNFKKIGWEEQIDNIADKILESKIEANKEHSSIMTEEVKKYLSELNTGTRHPQYGKPKSEHTKRLISMSEKGKNITPEQRKRISDSLKGNVHHTDREKELSRKASIAFIVPAKTAYQNYKKAGGTLGWNQFQSKFSKGELNE